MLKSFMDMTSGKRKKIHSLVYLGHLSFVFYLHQKYKRGA